MPRNSNAVFISYRRETAGILAMALHQNLALRGIDAFYDIESLRAGEFATIIMNQIAARPYFSVVLTPGTLQRCPKPKDWLRLEIEHAIATERMIVPVYTPDFDFDDFDRFLPGPTGAKVRGYQAVELPQKYFKFAVQQLAEEYLVPIAIEVTPTPVADQVEVTRLQKRAEEAEPVTQEQLTAQQYFEGAYNKGEAGDLEGAIADYNEAIRLNPGYAEAFYNRAKARQENGDLKGAIADYDEVIADHEEAMADYDEAIRLNLGNADAFYNLAMGREDGGDPEEAMADYDETIADYDEALRLSPGYAEAFYNRGLAREENGDLEGAIADLEDGRRVAPGHVDFDTALSRIRKRLKSQAE